MVSYTPSKPGRPSHTYHSYMIGGLRLMLEVEVGPGNRHTPKHSAPDLWALLDRLGPGRQPVWRDNAVLTLIAAPHSPMFAPPPRAPIEKCSGAAQSEFRAFGRDS